MKKIFAIKKKKRKKERHILSSFLKYFLNAPFHIVESRDIQSGLHKEKWNYSQWHKYLHPCLHRMNLTALSHLWSTFTGYPTCISQQETAQRTTLRWEHGLNDGGAKSSKLLCQSKWREEPEVHPNKIKRSHSNHLVTSMKSLQLHSVGSY